MASPVISFKALHRLSWGVMGAIASTLMISTGSALAQAVAEYGDTGSTVSAIQRQLGIAEDGAYGPETANAVEDFQARNGLTVDGVVGPETLRAMGLDYLGYYGGPDDYSDSYGSNYASDSGNSFTSGSRSAVVRTASGIGVNVRNAPNGSAVAGIDDGTRVSLTGRQQSSGGYTWAELAGGGWVATEYLMFDGIGGPSDPVGPIYSGQGRYVVVVPGDDQSDLRTARIYSRGSFIDNANQGSFINAGAFNDLSTAERLVDDLRDEGLNARVSVRRLW